MQVERELASLEMAEQQGGRRLFLSALLKAPPLPGLTAAAFCLQAYAKPPGVFELQLQLHGNPGWSPLLLQGLHRFHRRQIIPCDTGRCRWQRRATL